jgi:hypothetical protein
MTFLLSQQIAGAGDRVYTGFLQIGEEVEKRLTGGDILY